MNLFSPKMFTQDLHPSSDPRVAPKRTAEYSVGRVVRDKVPQCAHERRGGGYIDDDG